MEKGPVECIFKIRPVECVPKRGPYKWHGMKGMHGKGPVECVPKRGPDEWNGTHPLLGRHHLGPLVNQLFHDVKLASEKRVLLHVHLVSVHLE